MPQTQTSNNDLNYRFYNAIHMPDFAKSAGLEDCRDLELVERFVQPDRHDCKVLEVGAGYGRIVGELVRKGYRKISAIERSAAADVIERSQAAAIRSGQLTMYRQDLRDFQIGERFDLILWLFSGIADFSPEEQHRALSTLASHLADGGTLVLDLPPTRKSNATRIAGRTQVIELPDLPTYFGTVPTVDEMLDHGFKVGFRDVRTFRYQPIPGEPERDRQLFVFSERMTEMTDLRWAA